jgi:cytochrome c oxidase cbb3-type subunit 3
MLRTGWAVVVCLLSLELGFAGVVHAQGTDTASAQNSSTAGKPKKLNPFTGDSVAIAEGRKLYLKYNCYGCHGTMGGGGMGKALNDTKWAYGGDDASVFETITNGRQGGMPSFKDLIPEEERWKIIAYVRSFYKGDPAAIVW